LCFSNGWRVPRRWWSGGTNSLSNPVESDLLGHRHADRGPAARAAGRTLVLLIVRRALAVVVVSLALQATAIAATQTVVLTIPTMDCATCPITIRTALMRVAGVSKAKVSYDRREARVTFDDARTTIGALTKATADVGYPSFLSDSQK